MSCWKFRIKNFSNKIRNSALPLFYSLRTDTKATPFHTKPCLKTIPYLTNLISPYRTEPKRSKFITYYHNKPNQLNLTISYGMMETRLKEILKLKTWTWNSVFLSVKLETGFVSDLDVIPNRTHLIIIIKQNRSCFFYFWKLKLLFIKKKTEIERAMF